MKVELIAITPNAEQIVEEAGRTCYKSKIGNPSIIQNWIRSGHTSVVEHSQATFRISEVSRSFSHQIVRHRIASYSQSSQRYISESMFEYVTPDSIMENPSLDNEYKNLMSQIQAFYNKAVAQGIKKEDARSVLPNSCFTEIVVTMNFRSLRNFFTLRLDAHAQSEVRAVANEMLKIVKPLAPNVFFDFEV